MLPSLLSLLRMHSKREAHNEEWMWECTGSLECFFWMCILFCIYVCLLKEQPGYFVIISIPVIKVWIDIFHIHWYGNVYIQCHMLYILSTSLTCRFWQLDCRRENVCISFALFYFIFSLKLPYILYMPTWCHFHSLSL